MDSKFLQQLRTIIRRLLSPFSVQNAPLSIATILLDHIVLPFEENFFLQSCAFPDSICMSVLTVYQLLCTDIWWAACIPDLVTVSKVTFHRTRYLPIYSMETCIHWPSAISNVLLMFCNQDLCKIVDHNMSNFCLTKSVRHAGRWQWWYGEYIAARFNLNSNPSRSKRYRFLSPSLVFFIKHFQEEGKPWMNNRFLP